MEVVTGASRDLRGCVQNLKCSARGFGYRFLVYDYSGGNFDIPYPIDFEAYKKHGRACYHPKLSHKPHIILDALQRLALSHGDHFAYMDCDTEFIDPIPEVATEDYDVGITAHPSCIVKSWRSWHLYEEMSAYLNAGVMFFRKSYAAKKFCMLWIREIKKIRTRSDQHALHNIVKKLWDPFDWYMGDVREWHGIRIKLFDSCRYNYNGRTSLVWSDPKIIHHIVHAQGDRKVCADF